MKNLNIKKSTYFANASKIYVNVGSKKVLITGFGLYTIPISEGDKISASHLWTGSKELEYGNIKEGNSFLIKPRLSRLFALTIGIVFLVCLALFIFMKFRWSFFPLIPFALYIAIYLTILKNRYLIIEES